MNNKFLKIAKNNLRLARKWLKRYGIGEAWGDSHDRINELEHIISIEERLEQQEAITEQLNKQINYINNRLNMLNENSNLTGDE